MINALLRCRRTARLQSLHECIDTILAPLSECAYQAFQCQTKSRTELFVHFAITFHVAEIPETEHLLELKRGGQTRYRFQVRLIRKEMLHLSCSFSQRKLDRTIAIIDKSTGCHMSHREVERWFEEESLLSAVPLLSNFSFIGIHPCVDVYAIFWVESLHCLS